MTYTLKNGEVVEIDFYEDENFERYVAFRLFGGSTVVEYKCSEQNNLNAMIADIEEDYDRLKEEDYALEYSVYCD